MPGYRSGLAPRISALICRNVSLRNMSNGVDGKLHKIYRDKMSGATISRPGLVELLKDCRRRAIDVVVVWKFDRFARLMCPGSLVQSLCKFPVVFRFQRG